MRLEAIATVFQFLLPLALIAWVAVGWRRSREEWGSDVMVAATYLVAVALAAPWLVFPWYLPWIFGVLLMGAGALGASKVRAGGRRPRSWVGRAVVGVRVVFAGIFVIVTLLALSGRRGFDQDAVDLVFPLREGSYLVANGGSHQLINPHVMTLDGARYREYRGQSYAVDLVKVGSWGSRRATLLPEDPSGFAIFGDAVHAPCSGTVVRATDGQPDRRPPGTEPRTLEGNHVLLDCGAAWILLAHMKEGSVRAMQGRTVEVGDTLGLVGNSGRSDEPHLHIHAQKPGTHDAPLGGDPVPITFGGRQLVRNDRVRCAAY